MLMCEALLRGVLLTLGDYPSACLLAYVRVRMRVRV